MCLAYVRIMTDKTGKTHIVQLLSPAIFSNCETYSFWSFSCYFFFFFCQSLGILFSSFKVLTVIGLAPDLNSYRMINTGKVNGSDVNLLLECSLDLCKYIVNRFPICIAQCSFLDTYDTSLSM